MALVPPAVVTVTSTGPTPAGEVAVIWVALSTVKEPAALLPNLTAVTPEKLVPVMVTLVPPDVGPVFGLTLVTVGGPNCELRLRGRLHIGEQQKRRRPTAHRRAVAARVLATQPHMPQNPLRAPCACPELTRTPTPRTSCESALLAPLPSASSAEALSSPPDATTLGNPCVGKRTQRETVLRYRR